MSFVYDAWNRLRKVYADDGDGQFEPSDGQGTGEDALIAAYQYDGAKRRIEQLLADGMATHSYYNANWQLLEQRAFPLPLGEGQGEGGTALAVSYLYLWSPTYLDAPILRDRYDAEGELDASARVYYLGDANHNVTALVGLVETAPSVFAWQVAERYLYDPCGRATVCDADWTIRPDGPDANTTPGDESAFGNAVLYCGYYLDGETGLYHVRHRMYHATLSTWTARDPLEYRAGDSNVYRYCGNTPVLLVDPSGLEWVVDRQHDDRADADCDCGDTVKELAEKIKLSANEYQQWLREADGKGLPASADTKMTEKRKFTVPNTGYIDVSSFTWGFFGWYLMGYKDGLKSRWNSEGLKVVYTGKWTTSVTTITSHLGSSDIYKYAYIGHGDRGGTLVGMYPAAGSADDWVLPGEYTPFGIAEMHLIACHSNDGSHMWRRNVSRLGWISTVRGRGSLFTGEYVDENGTR